MTIREAIQILADTGSEIYCKICKVDAVDQENRSIGCTPLDGSAPLTAVNLQANQGGDVGVVLFPAVDSYVLVGFIDRAWAAVILTETIEKLELKIGPENPVEVKIEDGDVELKVMETKLRVTPDGVEVESPQVMINKVGDNTMKVTPDGVEIDSKQITMNSGSLGGLVKIAELTKILSSISTAFNSHTHTAPPTGGPTSPPVGTSITIPSQTSYEDGKIKH